MKGKRLWSVVVMLAMLISIVPETFSMGEMGRAGTYQTVSLGRAHSAAIKTDGTLWTWGWNGYGYGQLGDGSKEDKYTPVKIMDNVATVSLGGEYSAAIKTDGTLWTWGWNEYGQLGDGSKEDKYTPVKIMDNVAAISMGDTHSAAIKTDGTLWTWSRNEYGQLGDGTTEFKYTPVKIMDNVAAVSLGGDHSAAIKTDGSLWTWGDNEYGQLGDGTTENKYTPVKIMDNVAAISMGDTHSAAIKTDGTLWTWGENISGVLGDGTTDDKYIPVKIMDNVAAVSMGVNRGAAIKTDGTLWTWGDNYSGELGDGSTEDKYTPVKIMDNVAAVSMGVNHGAAIKTDGTLWTWGSNYSGKLGDGTTEDKYTPVKIMDDVMLPSGGIAGTTTLEPIQEQTLEPVQNGNVDLSAEFSLTKQDGTSLEKITYDANNKRYNADSFILKGEISIKNADALYADNVDVKITLPSGFSFDKNSDVKEKTVHIDTLLLDTIKETVYPKNAPIGSTGKAIINITGDNADPLTVECDLSVYAYTFEVNKYRADYLFDYNGDHEGMSATSLEKTFNRDTPSKIIYNQGKPSGMDLWQMIQKGGKIVDDPGNIADMAFEKKDMYEAIIWNIFDSAWTSEFMSCLDKTVEMSGKSLFDSACGQFKNIYNVDLANTKKLTKKQKEDLSKFLSDSFKKNHSKTKFVSDVSGYVDTALDAGKDIYDICQTAVAYDALNSMTDSMKQVLQKMYKNCPSSNPDLKIALLDCITVLNASQAAIAAKIGLCTATMGGKRIAQAGVSAFWEVAKTKFIASHPAAAVMYLSYKGSTLIANKLTNVDEICEMYEKLAAMVDVEDLAKSAYYDLKKEYSNKKTEFNAEKYNDSIDIMFNTLSGDCKAYYDYVKAIDDGLISQIENLLGNRDREKLLSQCKSIQEGYDTTHKQELTFWIYQLELDDPYQFGIYYPTIQNVKTSKKYKIECPVDVYLYDKNNKLAGSVVNNEITVDEDADIGILADGDEKEFIIDDSEYTFKYVGNDSGSMDISITEYENGTEVRNVGFDDIPLSKGKEYTSKDSGTNLTDSYNISGVSGTITPDYDTEADREAAVNHEIQGIFDLPEADEKTTETSFNSEVSEWAKEEVEEAYAEELIPDVLVGEDLTKQVSRAEFAAIAVQLYENLSGEYASGVENTTFVDIAGQPCKSEILKAFSLGITNGTTDVSFSPNTLISREQVATMLTRAYKRSEFNGWTLATDGNYPLNFMGVEKFDDDDEISDYAKESVYFMVRWDIINGVGDNKFAPKNNVTLGESYGFATREQAVVIALRSAKHL